ncbi:TPM domain-containing protein [Niabella sp. 3A5MI-3]|nr:TPM domain-containing protein [Niabella beijingensis]
MIRSFRLRDFYRKHEGVVIPLQGSLSGLLRILQLMIALLLLTGNGQAQEVLKIRTRTTDQTGTLSSGEIKTLDDRLYAIEKKTGRQVVVVMIPTTGSSSVEEYATTLFRENKIGSQDGNDGVLILVAKDDRRMRIEVGYGLEGTITDLSASRIIEEQMKPAFRNNDFGEGLKSAVNSVELLINGGSLPEAAPASRGGLTKEGKIFLLLMLVAFVSGILAGAKFLSVRQVLIADLVIIVVFIFFSFSFTPLLATPFAAFSYAAGYALARYRTVKILAGVLLLLAAVVALVAKFYGGIPASITAFVGGIVTIMGFLVYAYSKGILISSGGSRDHDDDSWSRSSSSSGSSSWSSSSSSSSGSSSSFSGGGGSSGGGGASGSW